LKFKKKHGNYALTVRDREGETLFFDSFPEAMRREYRFVVSSDFGAVGLTASKARKLAEAILKELDR
jgi:hypothetical protein